MFTTSLVLILAFSQVSLLVTGVPAHGRACACNRRYSPVCGTDGTTYTTYANNCTARCHDAVIVSVGSCPEPEVDPELSARSKPEARGHHDAVLLPVEVPAQLPHYEPDETACSCSFEYAPVCTTKGVYDNRCQAECHEAEVIDDSECPQVEHHSKRESEPIVICACHDIWQPVCANGVTFGSECNAKCSEGDHVQFVRGECPAPKPPCICTHQWDPVCVNGVTFGSACTARCSQGDDVQFVRGECRLEVVHHGSKRTSQPGPAPCICPMNYDPVCANGVTFSNVCTAGCGGIDTDSTRPGACPQAVQLPAGFSP